MPLTNLWIFWALLASAALAGYNSMFKLSGSDNMLLFLVAANIVAFTIYFTCLMVAPKEPMSLASILGNKAVIYGAITGVMIAILEVSCFLMLKNNPSGLSIGYSIIGIVSLLLTVLIGLFIFKEQINWQNMLGIVFAIIAVALLSYQKS